MSNGSDTIVSFKAQSNGSNCPFGNESVEFDLIKGGCLWLQGNSGVGKTTVSSYLAGLTSQTTLQQLTIEITKCRWNPSIAIGQRCGVLFQQTTLIDELTVGANVLLALQACSVSGSTSTEQEAKRLLESVGLDYAKTAGMKVTQLSGGMARRASLALQLAQRKHLIILDEPFAGLDAAAAASVASQLVQLRIQHGTSLLLISHEPHLAKLVMDSTRTQHNHTVLLTPPTTPSTSKQLQQQPPVLIGHGIRFRDRCLDKLVNYITWSMPLIGLAFVACGLAISMLSCDILQRMDVTQQVMDVLDEQVKPFLPMLTGQENNTLKYLMITVKVKSMLNTVIPSAKAKLFAVGMAKLFTLEIGPLLTALLLCGRIGGSYAGTVATMQATSQNQLLTTLGISPQSWTFTPSLVAALIASPILTAFGTTLALLVGGLVGPTYDIGTFNDYLDYIQTAIYSPLRLQLGIDAITSVDDQEVIVEWSRLLLQPWNVRTSYSTSSVMSVWIELSTWPPFFLVLKSITFMWITIVTAETCARMHKTLTSRQVPNVITQSVVLSSIFVICADWGFSQLWLQRH